MDHYADDLVALTAHLHLKGAVHAYADSAPLSAKLLKNSTLKTYRGFPDGMPTIEADTINSDLLAFIKS
jgi:hypothetical protein